MSQLDQTISETVALEDALKQTLANIKAMPKVENSAMMMANIQTQIDNYKLELQQKVFYHCPFLYFFGVPCPGCGMTRALIKACTFDFKAAFYYHPLFLLVIIAAVQESQKY